MEDSPWEVLESESLAEDPVRIVHERVRTHTGDVLDYYYQPKPIQVIFVLPLTPQGTVLMIKQYRHPTRRFLLEVPAGKVDPGESLEQAVRRELLEEVGARAGKLIGFPAFYPQPSFNAAVFNPFLATESRIVEKPRLESGELIETVEMPVCQAYDLLRAGKIADASTALTLFYARPWLEENGYC